MPRHLGMLVGLTIGCGAKEDDGGTTESADTDTDTDTDTDSDTDTDTAVAPPISDATEVEPLLDLRCGGCHGNSGGFTVGPLANLLATDPQSGLQYVEPFSPDDSYMWLKLNNLLK